MRLWVGGQVGLGAGMHKAGICGQQLCVQAEASHE